MDMAAFQKRRGIRNKQRKTGKLEIPLYKAPGKQKLSGNTKEQFEGEMRGLLKPVVEQGYPA